MVKFLKLTYRIINTHKISQILIDELSYTIYLSHSRGFGFFISSNGFFTSDTETIIINKKDIKDYNSVTEWIKKID